MDDRQMAASLTIHTWAAPPKLGVGKGRGSADDKGIKMDSGCENREGGVKHEI